MMVNPKIWDLPLIIKRYLEFYFNFKIKVNCPECHSSEGPKILFGALEFSTGAISDKDIYYEIANLQ